MVMTQTHAKCRDQKSLGSKARVETDAGDGRSVGGGGSRLNPFCECAILVLRRPTALYILICDSNMTSFDMTHDTV